MLQVQVSTPSPESSFSPSLADLSRNASVISSSSSSDSTSSLLLNTPRPRPMRNFSAPRSQSPQSPSRRSSRPPAYLARELGLLDGHSYDDAPSPESRMASVRARSKSRNKSVNGRFSTQDFKFGPTLGEGLVFDGEHAPAGTSTGWVSLCTYTTQVKHGVYLATGQEFAIKVIDKNHLQRKRKLQTAHAEKNALIKLGSGHPGIVRLHWAFQDEWSLFFVLDLARNGELQSRISRLGSLSTTCAKYFGAQLVDALEYMHSKGVIHRDLKPENLLLDDEFRIKITDFGTGKLLEPGVERTKSFVGTAQYVSPELIEFNETSESSDLWALGCIIYQMIAGRFAFQGLSEYLTWQKIKQLDYTFPEGFDTQAKDLVQKLLVRDPSERLGAGPPGSTNDRAALRAHPFFLSIKWDTLWTDPAPPLVPGLVEKTHPLAAGEDPNWEDVGAAWDDIVSGDGEGSDEMGWAPDADAPAYVLVKQSGAEGFEGPGLIRHDDVGPMGEVPRYAHAQRKDLGVGLGAASAVYQTEEDTATIVAGEGPHRGQEGTLGLGVPAKMRDSSSTGSGSSSSDGSPVEKLGTVLESMTIDRGRNRAQTPVQGNGPCSNSDFKSVLLPDEVILFNSAVEARSLKRRASRLLPISVSPLKPRQLILTTERLVCLKQATKGTRGVVAVKHELSLRPLKLKEKEKDREARDVVVSVEPKGGREFVVLTSAKSQTYAADTPLLASLWIKKISEALRGHSHPPS